MANILPDNYRDVSREEEGTKKMREYGIFDDSGLLEGDFGSREDAMSALNNRYADDGAHVGIVCPEHEEQEQDFCEECGA